MKTTKMDKQELLSVLETNRRKHQEEFDQAMKTWTKKATKALRKAAEKAEADGEINPIPLSKLPRPVNFLDAYDTVINRLKYEVEGTVELDEQEFNSWVQNDWGWNKVFAANTSLYTG